MCRNIRTLYNYDPPCTADDISAAALQYVRKVSGYRSPSQLNAAAFDRAVSAIADATGKLLDELQTSAPPRDRQAEMEKARERSRRRFGGA